MDRVSKILVVDDEESLRDSFQYFLKQCGFEVFSAPDPEAAGTLLPAHDFDVAVVDRNFSAGQNGVSFVREIKEIQPYCQTILISANPTFESAAEGIESDVNAYLVKPVKKDTLCRQVLDAVEKNAAVKEMDRYGSLFHSIFGNSPHPIVISDLDDRVVFANPGFFRVFGYPSAEILGRCLPNVPASDRENTEREMADLIRGMVVKERETVRFTRDRRRVRVTISLFLAKDARNQPSHIVRILRDVTDARIRAEERVQARKMEAMGHMAGEIGHNFSLLLDGISGRAHALASGAGKERVAQIENACRKGRHLVGRLLELGSDTAPGNAETDINAVSAKIFGLMSQANLRSIGIDWQEAEETGRAKIDPGLLEQCLFHLVVNARDAILEKVERGDDPGQAHHAISIRSRKIVLPEPDSIHGPHLPAGPYIRIAVSDTGPGIPEEIRDRIFDPFFSAEKTDNRDGLGLSTVYRIVRNHHGVVTVDSSPGKGTTFFIFLPAGEP